MKFPIAVFALTATMYISCDSGDQRSLVNSNAAPAAIAPAQAAAQVTPVVQETSSAKTLNPAHGQPGHRCDIAVGAPLNGTAVQQPVVNTQQPAIPNPQPITLPAIGAANGVALNPKHGQPGHRCDIAVGAPLNGTAAQKPVVNTQQAVTPNPQPITLPSMAAASGVALNPKHGQPGHRCDLQVGAPLNSQPAQAPAATKSMVQLPQTGTATTPMVLPQTGSAAPMVLPQTGTASAGKVNPQHGQPGHRCDIAVGAPLN